MEDAEALSLLLAHNLEITSCQELNRDNLTKTFAQYAEVRKAHVEKVLDAGNRAGDTSRDSELMSPDPHGAINKQITNHIQS